MSKALLLCAPVSLGKPFKSDILKPLSSTGRETMLEKTTEFLTKTRREYSNYMCSRTLKQRFVRYVLESLLFLSRGTDPSQPTATSR